MKPTLEAIADQAAHDILAKCVVLDELQDANHQTMGVHFDFLVRDARLIIEDSVRKARPTLRERAKAFLSK